MKKRLFVFIILSIGHRAYAQDQVEASEEFKIKAEIRPRAEVRNGYRTLRHDTTRAAFFISQRSRLQFRYQRVGLIFHTSVQDVRVWGETVPGSTERSTLEVFETYIQPSIIKSLSVRIGRQQISYDNQRLFSESNFHQNGRTHDAVRFIYDSDKLKTELVGAFNQNGERIFETNYSPSFDNYKVLLVHYMRYYLSEDITFTSLNATDGYQDKTNPRVTHYRFTNGGRVEYEHGDWYLTLAGYYQQGHSATGKDIKAYYFQPEVKFKPNIRAAFWLGAEIFSGEDINNDAITRSFVPLYGSNHKFLGNLDYFTSYPVDFNNLGIINPYLFLVYDLTKKLSIRIDNHLFYSAEVLNDHVSSKYLGFENDMSFLYSPNDCTKLNFGFSWMVARESMELVKNGGNSNITPYWSYLEMTFTPELFKWTAKGTQ